MLKYYNRTIILIGFKTFYIDYLSTLDDQLNKIRCDLTIIRILNVFIDFLIHLSYKY